MATEKRLIDVCAEIRKIDECLAERQEQSDSLTYRIFEAVKTALKKAPTVDAVEVVDPELRKAIKLLIKQYEHSKNSEYVHSPIAHAFYHTWKQLERDGNGRL